MRTTCTSAYSQSNIGRCIGTTQAADWFTATALGACPCLSQANAPAPLASHCSSTLERGLPQLRREFSRQTQWRLRPEAASEKGRGSHYWRSHRQRIRSSPDLWSWPDHCSPCRNTCEGPTRALPALQHSVTPGWQWYRLREENGHEGQRRLRPQSRV